MNNRLLLLFLFALSLSAGEKSLGQQFHDFRNVLVDLRNSRGGNGDVAAGYLTAMDLKEKLPHNSRVTVLVDRDSFRILNKLTFGNSEFHSKISVVSLQSVSDLGPYDLYLEVSSASNEFRLEEGLRKVFKKDAVFIVQSVLGNTVVSKENPPSAKLQYRESTYSIEPAGLSLSEAGVYNDYVARKLRNSSVVETERFVKSHLRLVQDEASKQMIEYGLYAHKEHNIRLGLVYGLSAFETSRQFGSYVRGIPSSESRLLLTPSSIKSEAIADPKVRSRLVLVSNPAELPRNFEAGKVYVLKTSTLPHKVFVGLLALTMKQGLVPLGAGDGFMSAALALGAPFALTRVEWNSPNLLRLADRLSAAATQKHETELIKKVFVDLDLSASHQLGSYKGLFEKVSKQIPILTNSILGHATQIRGSAGTALSCKALL